VSKKEPPKAAKSRPRQPRRPDQRIRRTRERLGNALITLIQEKPMETVTVQEVLDRAGVGRSTFYLHYRDKDDLLLSQLEMFLEFMSTRLSKDKEQSHRVAPVNEFFAHIGSQTKLLRMLGDHLPDFFELAQGYFARGIAQRLKERKPPKLRHSELAARSNALAGSLLSLLRWWLDRGSKESPEAMDDLFHRMVWSGLQ
jgi:AcrR family transcriptional regulator